MVRPPPGTIQFQYSPNPESAGRVKARPGVVRRAKPDGSIPPLRTIRRSLNSIGRERDGALNIPA
jgi:hypothetical protein